MIIKVKWLLTVKKNLTRHTSWYLFNSSDKDFCQINFTVCERFLCSLYISQNALETICIDENKKELHSGRI